jgi:glycosyltransferase involved in cell wall biosynthesis
MKVLIVAEYYPRAHDPVSGIWAHRQTLATRDAGAEVRVLVLHRPVPPLASLRAGDPRATLAAARAAARQPASLELDGLRVDYVRYVSPPRPWSYGSWGAWAAPALGFAVRRLQHGGFDPDLIHAHYAVPAGDAVRRAAPSTPLVVSVHGHDVYGVAARGFGARAVQATLGHACLVLANSAGTARRSADHGARATRVVHLGADVPADVAPPGVDPQRSPTLVTVGHLVARKRHADVIAALPALRERHPELRYVIVGDGPERARLAALAASLGVARMVELRGKLPHDQAVACARSASVFVLPSVDEAFGVGYIEAMAGAVPAIGCRGEDGPEEIAASGGGMALVDAGDVAGLTREIDGMLSDRDRRAELGRAARATVEREFTWKRCGSATLTAYRDVLGGPLGEG